MGISQVSWGWLLKATPMHSYTQRTHTQDGHTQAQACNDPRIRRAYAHSQLRAHSRRGTLRELPKSTSRLWPVLEARLHSVCGTHSPCLPRVLGRADFTHKSQDKGEGAMREDPTGLTGAVSGERHLDESLVV